MNLIEKIKESGLTGRGGAGFSTGIKWEMVKKAHGKQKYVIANGSEGEPGVHKDEYILKHFADKLTAGIFLAMKNVGASKGFIYLRADLYNKYKEKLKKTTAGKNIKIWREDGKYLCGEETTLINSIEAGRAEPRLKPPFPTTQGLYGAPTLINNIETIYRVWQINECEYKSRRFYTISGKVRNPGVFEYPENITIEKILKLTKNYPSIKFFVQVGGGACSPIFTQAECRRKHVGGTGAVIVHDLKENLLDLLRFWTKFFLNRNCGQCVPCREGFFRINEILKSDKVNYKALREILEIMADTSFCGLGQYAPTTYLTFLDKILKK